MRVEIQPLGGVHCRAAARLHLACLPTPFLGLAGVEILGCVYRCLAEGRGGCGFVAVDGRRLLGFVCGMWCPQDLHRRLILRYGPQLAFWSLAQLAVSPPGWKGLACSIGHRLAVVQAKGSYELRPLVVAPRARGRGVGSALTARLIEDARQRGLDTVYLHAEADNHPANAFYQRAGFIPTKEIERSGRKYLRYEYDLSAGQAATQETARIDVEKGDIPAEISINLHLAKLFPGSPEPHCQR